LIYCRDADSGLRSGKESEAFWWSRIPNDTRGRVGYSVRLRLRKSNWIIFYITLLSWDFLLKWCNFLWNFYWNREFLLCTTMSIEC